MSKPSAAIPAPRQTIFRRKRSANFTVLGNAVLFDRRLDLDECAAIVKLLAKPHDWQIKPSHLQAEWGVGRAKFYRIVNKLIRLGYITRGEMIKDAWQRFTACEYIINEEPEAPPEGEVDDAFIDESDDAPETETSAEDDDAAADASPVVSVPQSRFPHTAQPHTENQHGEKELRNIQTIPPLPPTSENHIGTDPPVAGDLPNAKPPDAVPMQLPNAGPSRPTGEAPTALRDRTPSGAARGPISETASGTSAAVVPTFEKFMADYRPEPYMSEAGARRRWMRMDEQQRIDAVKYLPDFRADRVKKGWKMPDMRRYLLDQHWAPYAKAATEKPKSVPIKPYSAQWYRWREYRIATGQSVKFFDHYPTRYQSDWYEPSEWPPALPPKKEIPPEPPPDAPALGPPGDSIDDFT